MLLVLRRVAVFLVTVVLASIAVFAVLGVLPGDPAQIYAGTQATPQQVEALRKEFGLDAPIPTRYVRWVGGLVRGDLGTTFISKRSIASEISSRISLTLPLVMISMLVALVIALPLGVISAVAHRRSAGAAISVLAQLGLAVPAFWAGLMLISLVAVRWQLLPAGGFTPWSDSVTGALRSLALPALSLAIVVAAILTRYVRSAVLDVLRDDYLRTARAKGMTLGQALRRHGLRNAAVPIVTVIGLQFGGLLVGAVVIESVFTLPGLGKLLLDNIGNREIILIQDLVMFITVAILFINLVVDLALFAIDPRLREGGP